MKPLTLLYLTESFGATRHPTRYTTAPSGSIRFTQGGEMFKSEDDKRREAAAKADSICSRCNGTGTVGIGGRGAATASTCGSCGGSGQRR